MYLVHARELLDLSGHDATVVPLPRPHVALAAWRDRAALLTPDLQIWRLVGEDQGVCAVLSARVLHQVVLVCPRVG